MFPASFLTPAFEADELPHPGRHDPRHRVFNATPPQDSREAESSDEAHIAAVPSRLSRVERGLARECGAEDIGGPQLSNAKGGASRALEKRREVRLQTDMPGGVIANRIQIERRPAFILIASSQAHGPNEYEF